MILIRLGKRVSGHRWAILIPINVSTLRKRLGGSFRGSGSRLSCFEESGNEVVIDISEANFYERVRRLPKLIAILHHVH